MTEKSSIENFFEQKKIAVVGVSRSSKKFGNTIFDGLKSKGFTVYAVNRKTGETDEGIYPDLKSLPEKADSIIVVVKPEEAVNVVKDAVEQGIRHIWFQQGAGSPEAVEYCRDNGVNVIDNECIFMFAEPVTSIHRFHRGLWKLFGRYPK
ncbi:CoA-binding protein [candidate division KSB1 bacterium]